MDRNSSHPMWFSSFSSRVAPKPLASIEGQGPRMPKACLPWINPRRFNQSHDAYDSNENGSCNVRGCTRIRNSGRSTKSNSDLGEEPESPQCPCAGPVSDQSAFKLLRMAVRTSVKYSADLRVVSGFSTPKGNSFKKKLFTSCLAANTQLEDLEMEAEVHRTPQDPFFSPGRKPPACELEMHATIATRIYPDSSKGLLRLPGCLRFETQSESDATVDSECYLPPDTYLPPMELEDVVRGMKTLVLNLNGTLIHPSLQPTDECDFRVPAWVNGRLSEVFVVKRPGLDNFLQTVARMYEVVVFTSCSRQYTDLVLDILDRKANCIRYRLYEDSCILTEEGWLKDLSELGRDLRKVITVDNKPYSLQPANLLQVGKYTGDKTDRELDDLLLELELVWRLNV